MQANLLSLSHIYSLAFSVQFQRPVHSRPILCSIVSPSGERIWLCRRTHDMRMAFPGVLDDNTDTTVMFINLKLTNRWQCGCDRLMCLDLPTWQGWCSVSIVVGLFMTRQLVRILFLGKKIFTDVLCKMCD